MNTNCAHLKSTVKDTLKTFLIVSGICLIGACSSSKDTATNRALQNLSARYNYLYNAKILLDEYENNLLKNHPENYEAILPVFRVPDSSSASSDKSLAAVISKAQAIIAEKNVSNYLDDAYMLLGKANYYQGNYFSAAGFFEYVAKTYGKNVNTRLAAINWQARSEFALQNANEISILSDTLGQLVDSVKREKAAPLATLAQFHISDGRYDEAVRVLKAALRQPASSTNKIRWNYILAQLYARQNDTKQSLDYFSKVVNSNAPFDMYFNANLNKINLESAGSPQLNREQRILALLKDDKNEGYEDQIYFKVAESYAERNRWDDAEKYYMLSAAAGKQNMMQKGLNYLRLADLRFRNQNYLSAKLYYDSAISALPKIYPGYALIEKKAQNLQYLADRYKIISWQDTIQKIAGLPPGERQAMAAQFVNKNRVVVQPVTQVDVPVTNNINDPFGDQPIAAAFYFSNAAAISTGYSDFLRKWGNRPLEDNWRQSTRSAAQAANAIQASPGFNPASTNAAIDSVDTEIKQFLDNLPLSPSQIATSNQKIVDAYFEIGTFYQQQLNDRKEAARIFELILERFPQTARKDAILYSLFRLYQGNDEQNSNVYRDRILTEFPNSTYAKVINDPEYLLRENSNEIAVQKSYNSVYAAYEKKDYAEVKEQVNTALRTYPKNTIRSQFDYLKAIAIGRTNKVDSLLIAFTNIVNAYPEDKVIVPLVQDHIAYIVAHIDDFNKRKVALVDFDPTASRFIAQQTTKPANNTPVTPIQSETKQVEDNRPPVVTPEKAPGIKTDGTFTNAPSSTYYFVVNVTDASFTLSSSRFGIGQFNRGNFADFNFRHQLVEFGDDQLIYVGNFPDLESVKRYSDLISPQLKSIMKVPAGKFQSFIVSKENFEKIVSRDKINQYLTFYSNSY